MLTDYIETAMHLARYELLDDGEGFYGEIPECQGVFANASSLERCRDQLAEVLEDWILFRVSQGMELPEVAGNRIEIRKVA